MATQIVVLNGDGIFVDNSYNIVWADRGNSMPAIPDSIHAVIWNDLVGQNEIQTKDPSTGMMAGNTNLSSTSDAVGSTTIAELLSWAETRNTQIEAAETAELNAKVADTWSDGETWRDYDPNYS